MKIESIHVGLPQSIDVDGRLVTTAINKSPVQGPVHVGFLNIVGDKQADLRVHGGPNKAVYAYGMDALATWKTLRPNDPMSFGAMGENLSLTTLDEANVYVGDHFKVGTAEMLAVQPRMPCYKLAVKYDDPKILRQFVTLKRPGVYFRVLKEGEINVGDVFHRIGRESTLLSIATMFEFVTGLDQPSPTMAAEIIKLKGLPPELIPRFENFL